MGDMKENKRLDYMDIAKGVGIICVILGHMGNAALDRVIFSFHMPLFFLISGFFLSREKTAKEILVKRSRQLIVPYVMTCTAVIVLVLLKNIWKVFAGKNTFQILLREVGEMVFASLYGSGANYEEPFPIIQIGAIWFLLALFLGSYIVKKAEETRFSAFWIILVAVVGYYSSRIIWLPWSVQAAMTASVFIFVGMRLREYAVFESGRLNEICLISFTIWLKEIVYGASHLSIVRNYYPNGVFDFIGGCAGAVCIIIMLKYMYEHIRIDFIWDKMKWLGKNSLTILCLHLVELDVIPWYSVFGGGGMAFMLTFMCKLLWAILGTWVITQVHFKIKEFKIKGMT